MSDVTALRDSLDGEVFSAGSPGYEAVRRPVHAAYQDARPRLVVVCRSVSDVVEALGYARATGSRIVPRGGGHCFAGRSSTDGIVLDLSGLDSIAVTADGIATIGAGARLAQVYAALHASGRTLPAGCGPTVGITGLTLGGGIGLLGRKYGLTCDRLVGVQVVLADGRIVECDEEREPDLFWGLRGAGGGQFGVVTSLRFATVPEPVTIRVEAVASGPDLADLVTAWQEWSPDAPDELTANLSVVAEPGVPVRARLFGASLVDEGSTRELLRDFPNIRMRPGLTFRQLKAGLAEPLDGPPRRIRSEFFSGSMSRDTVGSLLANLDAAPARREIAFTAMAGAYNRVAEDATAFAHRGARFLLEQNAAMGDPWLDKSWAIAHVEGSGRVYPNFPDPALEDWPGAYHAGNYPRLRTVKAAYDPHRFFDFPQAIL